MDKLAKSARFVAGDTSARLRAIQPTPVPGHRGGETGGMGRSILMRLHLSAGYNRMKWDYETLAIQARWAQTI